MALCGVVIGAGWAGEGHTIAMRDAGVEVVALCGRSEGPTRARATALGVPEARLDWHAALEELRPDIVAIATPGHTHAAMAARAAELGCHVVCEKPLALDADDARAMLDAVERAGVRHAYAATGCYSPAALHAAQLVADGAIGAVREIESYVRFAFPVTPYGWVHDRARGGGGLRNVFTHKLAQALRVTGGWPARAAGAATPWSFPVPVLPEVHDFRESFAPLSEADLAHAEWRTSDVDGGYTVVVDIALAGGRGARAIFHGAFDGAGHVEPFMAFYGEEGTLVVPDDMDARAVRRCPRFGGEWEELPAPPELLAALPAHPDPVQRAWCQLYRELAADLGGGPRRYATFRDGYEAMVAIGAAESGAGWVQVPERGVAARAI